MFLLVWIHKKRYSYIYIFLFSTCINIVFLMLLYVNFLDFCVCVRAGFKNSCINFIFYPHTHARAHTHTHTHSLTHSLTHTLTHSLTHTLTHTLPPFCLPFPAPRCVKLLSRRGFASSGVLVCLVSFCFFSSFSPFNLKSILFVPRALFVQFHINPSRLETKRSR